MNPRLPVMVDDFLTPLLAVKEAEVQHLDQIRLTHI
jgi:hypothetical protein